MSLDMYAEHILELYKDPNNFGKLEGATNSAEEYNSTCGDKITVELIIKNDVVEDVMWHGEGCAISSASASLLTDKIKGMKSEHLKSMNKDDILELLHIPISPGRIKCATLALEAIKQAVKC